MYKLDALRIYQQPKARAKSIFHLHQMLRNRNATKIRVQKFAH